MSNGQANEKCRKHIRPTRSIDRKSLARFLVPNVFHLLNFFDALRSTTPGLPTPSGTAARRPWPDTCSTFWPPGLSFVMSGTSPLSTKGWVTYELLKEEPCEVHLSNEPKPGTCIKMEMQMIICYCYYYYYLLLLLIN